MGLGIGIPYVAGKQDKFVRNYSYNHLAPQVIYLEKEALTPKPNISESQKKKLRSASAMDACVLGLIV